jgi:hypothetical protein
MNQTLRPLPQLAEVLPGALTLALILVLVYDHNPDALNYFSALNTSPGVLAILAAAFFASWIFGTFLDTIRNALVEYVVDRRSKHPLKWEFFVLGERDKVTQLDDYFFAYYQAKANYAIGIFLFGLMCIGWFPTERIGRITLLIATISFVLFIIDSRSLRGKSKT